MKTCSRRKGKAPPAESRHKLIAYQIYEEDSAPIRAAPRERRWMEDADKKFPYRCLPLVIANQYGWEILSTHHVRASWDGTSGPDALHVESLRGKGRLHCHSHFGEGVLTFQIPGPLSTYEIRHGTSQARLFELERIGKWVRSARTRPCMLS